MKYKDEHEPYDDDQFISSEVHLDDEIIDIDERYTSSEELEK